MSTGPQPPGEQFGPSPQYCALCNHSGKLIGCNGCGGPYGGNGWGPCTYCQAKLGEENTGSNPPPPPMTSTLYGSIEATEPRTLPPLAAFAADASVQCRDPIEEVVAELECQREAIKELSRRITELTQAVLGRNLCE